MAKSTALDPACSEKAKPRGSRSLFLIAAFACFLPWISPSIALAIGLVFGLLGANPWPRESACVSKHAIRICVIGLGFGVNLHTVIAAGRGSFTYTAMGIAISMAAGILLGRLFEVPRNTALLIAAGTSICGASAIAAICPVLNADEDETAVSLAAIFVLNALALFIFPPIGLWSGLTQSQFGLWAALAIHDASSVVGAGLKYGATALSIATTVKLVRTMWIVPLTFVIATMIKGRMKIVWPWFILLFVVAAFVRQVTPSAIPLWDILAKLSRAAFSVVLFLIGSGLSFGALRRLGWRPLAAGAALWLLVSVCSLLCIKQGLISL